MIDVMYFAWVRERIGLPKEQVETQAETVSDLVTELMLDQELSTFDAPLAGVREVAFFPPMTGG